MLASSWPRNSIPSPMASPRFNQPQHTVEIFWSIPDQRSHSISPVLALAANTSSFPVTTYMIPSLTSGVASAEYLPPNPEPFKQLKGAWMTRLKGSGFDLLQHGVALVCQVAAIRHPVPWRLGSAS